MSIQTGLYIHIPWCIKKCPYCDFNSHELHSKIDEKAYVDALIEDFQQDVILYQKSIIHSVFIGGGTPSLFSAEAYERLFAQLKKIIPWQTNIEVTLEANPGTLDANRFKEYRDIGINRLSIGVQSFQDNFLKKLGRIHDSLTAHRAIEAAHDAGFEHLNIDLMYGLPGQSTQDALYDLNQAIESNPNHISWYELTIEPNTVFYKRPPQQPQESIFLEIEQKGRELLESKGFMRYEISAYGKQTHCQHNLNYWQFGDYFGIGAGAHGKLSQLPQIHRTTKARQPQSYVTKQKCIETRAISKTTDIIFEFMLNACRLLEPISKRLFTQQTGLPIDDLLPYLQQAENLGLLIQGNDHWQLTAQGLQFNNELMQLFLN